MNKKISADFKWLERQQDIDVLKRLGVEYEIVWITPEQIDREKSRQNKGRSKGKVDQERAKLIYLAAQNGMSFPMIVCRKEESGYVILSGNHRDEGIVVSGLVSSFPIICVKCTNSIANTLCFSFNAYEGQGLSKQERLRFVVKQWEQSDRSDEFLSVLCTLNSVDIKEARNFSEYLDFVDVYLDADERLLAPTTFKRIVKGARNTNKLREAWAKLIICLSNNLTGEYANELSKQVDSLETNEIDKVQVLEKAIALAAQPERKAPPVPPEKKAISELLKISKKAMQITDGKDLCTNLGYTDSEAEELRSELFDLACFFMELAGRPML